MRKEPWEEHPEIWKNKTAFFTFLRGALRRAVWEKYPVKLSFKNSVCKPPPEGYTGRAKSGAYCALTGEWVGKSAGEIDHKIGNVPLREWDDVLPFIQHLCASADDLQFVSKEAHRVKSYAERMGISFKEAQAQKEAIQIIKDKKDKEWLSVRGIEPGSNQQKRREQIVERIIEEGS